MGRFTSKRRLFGGRVPQNQSPDLFDNQRDDPNFVAAAGLARRERRMSFTKAGAPSGYTSTDIQPEERTRAMQFLAGHQSTKAARRNVEDSGRVVMSVNDDGIVRLAHHGGALHLTYSGLIGTKPDQSRFNHQHLDTILNLTLPVVEAKQMAETVQQIYKMVTRAMKPLTDRNAEEFGGHTIHMALDNVLHEALEPGLSTALGAVSNAAATNMATRMARSGPP